MPHRAGADLLDAVAVVDGDAAHGVAVAVVVLREEWMTRSAPWSTKGRIMGAA